MALVANKSKWFYVQSGSDRQHQKAPPLRSRNKPEMRKTQCLDQQGRRGWTVNRVCRSGRVSTWSWALVVVPWMFSWVRSTNQRWGISYYGPKDLSMRPLIVSAVSLLPYWCKTHGLF